MFSRHLKQRLVHTVHEETFTSDRVHILIFTPERVRCRECDTKRRNSRNIVGMGEMLEFLARDQHKCDQGSVVNVTMDIHLFH